MMATLICVIFPLAFLLSHAVDSSNNKFDVIFFVQDWPVSDCIDWQKNRGGRCSIKDYHHWTINGIHTGRHDGQKSPEFCDKKPLQISKLRPLLANLTLEWTSDHARTDQAPFWSYIWYKYGSCFQASRLHGPLKYFTQALQWHQRYPLDKFLANGAIQPGNPYLVEDIHLAIKSATYGKIPALDCVRSNNDTVVLSQITLCFNLRLRLIHCRSKMFPQGIFGNCPRRSVVVYPKDSDHIGAWSQTAIGVGSVVGLLVILWLIRFGYVKFYHPSPISRGLNDRQSTSATGMEIPFNIDIEDLIERYRALGGEI